MSKNFQEPEEVDMDKNSTEIVDDFNPLDEAIVEKEYTKHNVKINPNDFKTDIPEPAFTPPPMSGMMTDEEKVKKPSEPFNPEMKQMSNKDKNDASEKFAEMIMGGYKWLNEFADGKLLFDDKKLMKLQMAGELDLSVPFPYSQSRSMSAGEMIEEYNQQSKGTIYVSEKFEQETMPVLTKVLAKRGIGMTDEQYLAYLFGKDILHKTFLINQSLSVKKDILNQLKELTQAYRGGGTPPMPQSTAQPTPPPTEPTPMYDFTEPEEYVAPRRNFNPEGNVNDMVNMMTGSLTEEEMGLGYQEPDIEEVSDYEEPRTKTTKKQGKKTNTKRGRTKRS